MKDNNGRLQSTAYQLAEEYRDGVLSHLVCAEWQDTWDNLIRELRTRCPGFKDAEYKNALNDAFYSSR